MTAPHNTREERLNRTENHGAAAVNVAGDGGWIDTLQNIAPILGGVGSFGSMINAIIAAREDAASQKALISALQTIESDLEGIKNELNAIFEELKDIETDIEGLGLNDKLTAIEAWGEEMAALDPEDKHGAVHLATAMMDASHGATNLLGCMTGLHNALVGLNIGKPLMTLLDAKGILQIRARLIQGLRILAFGCAFNSAEKYDYGVFLLQWAANFEQQVQMYLAANKDPIPMTSGPNGLNVGDTIVIYRYAQKSLPNVAVSVVGATRTMNVYTGTLGYDPTTRPEDPDWLSFLLNDKTLTGYVDVINDLVSTDRSVPPGPTCWPDQHPNQYLSISLLMISGIVPDLFTARTSLVCGARFDPNQTFLGAVNGQLAWVASTGQTTYPCSIHNGENTAAPLLTYDPTKGSVTAQSFDKLQRLTPALWTVTWDAKNSVTISPVQPESSPPAFLSLDPDGNWMITRSPATLKVTAAAPKLGRIMNPLQMPPTPAAIQSAMTPTGRTVLFHQL